MSPALPESVRKVVAEHKHDTTLYVLATGPASTTLAEGAVKRIPAPRTTRKGAVGRRVLRVPRDDPVSIKPTGSWCLGVVLELGFDFTALIRFARAQGLPNLGRILFHLPRDVDPIQALDPWTVLTGTPDFETFQDLSGLVQHLLVQNNLQTYQDHSPAKSPGVP